METIPLLNFISYLSDILDILFSPFSWPFLYEALVISFEFVTLSSTDEIIISLRNLSPFCRRIESKSPTSGPSAPLGAACGGGSRTDAFCFRDDLEDCTDMALWLGVGWEMKLRWFWSRSEVTMSPFAVTSTVLPDSTGWGCECCRLSWKL